MNSVPNLLPLDDAVLALIADVTGCPSDIARAPLIEGSSNSAPPPYTIVYPMPGGRGFSGPGFAAPNADVVVYYQVRSVGERRDQVRALSDRVRQAFLAREEGGAFVHALEIENGSVMDRWPEGSPGMLRRDGSLFYVDEDYCVGVTGS